MSKEIVTNLRAVKISDWKLYVPGGYQLLSGWAIEDMDSGRLFAGNGSKHPYLNRKGVVLEIIQGGLYTGFNTVPMQGAA